MRRYYISGPMSGHEDSNFPAFADAADRLRAGGLDVVSPHEVDAEHGKPWDVYLRNDIKALVDCTDVVLLEGYHNSRGARLEIHIARALGMRVHVTVEDALADTPSVAS